jgi:hypothetical protein
MSAKQIQDRLRCKNIVVTGLKHPSVEFNKAGLRAFCPINRNISIQGLNFTLSYDRYITDKSYQDHSIRHSSGFIPATVTGQAKDLLNHAASRGKILNGLDFPMWKDSQWEHSPYATDMVAWDVLLGNAHCSSPNTPYPTGHMRWGLGGTAHVVSTLHMDSDGLATIVRVVCGKKLWALYHPSPRLPLSNINAFLLPATFQLDRIPPKAKSGLEGVVLRPGDMLYVWFNPRLSSLVFSYLCIQADATRCTPLRIWPRGCDNPRRSFLLFFSDASHFGKPHTHLCPQRLHLQHFPSSFSSVTATHCHLLGAGITRGTC